MKPQPTLKWIAGTLDVVARAVADLEKRFTKQDTRFDGLETRFDGLETKFDKNFANLEKKIDDNSNRIDRNIGHYKKQEAELAAVGAKYNRHERRIGGLETRVFGKSQTESA